MTFLGGIGHINNEIIENTLREEYSLNVFGDFAQKERHYGIR